MLVFKEKSNRKNFFSNKHYKCFKIKYLIRDDFTRKINKFVSVYIMRLLSNSKLGKLGDVYLNMDLPVLDDELLHTVQSCQGDLWVLTLHELNRSGLALGVEPGELTQVIERQYYCAG